MQVLLKPAPAPDDSVPPPAKPRYRQWIAAAFGVWLLTGIYLVNTQQQAVLTRFGAVVEPRVLPGIHLSLPWPIDRVTRLKVQQLQRLVVGGDAADTVVGRSQPLRSQFLTGDQNILNLRVVVQYSVGSPVDYLYRTNNVAQVVTSAVESALAARVARQTVDTILTSGKAAIQDDVRNASQRVLDEYHAGVILSTINIESVTPPPEAADAFRDVASARADSARIVNEAQGYANDVIPRARGEAQQLMESAQGYRQRKIDEAQGDAARFTQVAGEYAKATQVNGERLYLETMESILPKIKKLLVDNKGNLDLTIIRRGEK
jgi:membrane protease subunit HflK